MDLEENQAESTPAVAMDLDSEAVEAEEAAAATANEPVTETAFEHFNNLALFFPVTRSDDAKNAQLEASVASLNYQMFSSEDNKTKLQTLTLDEFFAEIQTKERTGMTLYHILRSYKLVEKALTTAETEYNAWLNKNALAETEQASDALEEDTAGAGIPAEAPAEDPETAFDHFNDPELFFSDEEDDEEDDEDYDDQVVGEDDDGATKMKAAGAKIQHQKFCFISNKAKLEKLSLDEFFEKAKKKGATEMEVNKFFRSHKLFGKALTKAHIEYNKWQGKDLEIQRMVPVDYEISTHPLFQKYDLERLKAAIENVFNWYADSEEESSKKKSSKKERSELKVGPYLCFVQSSGMGKTKLMYEYREASLKEKSTVASCLILPLDKSTRNQDTVPFNEDGNKVFDFRIDFMEVIQGCTEALAAAKAIYSKLDGILKDTLKKNREIRESNREKKRVNKKVAVEDCNMIVLMFDESQLLVDDRFTYDAFLFRCVRVWLRKIRGQQKVVAVFAGTNSKITNFLVKSDQELLPGKTYSRQWQQGNYHEKGSSQLYPPFYHTATIGSCRREPATGPTEYERATNYGRPLFAVMANKGTLHKKISTVLCRMLLVPEGDDWESALQAVANFLGTRVQLGETSFDMISNLVAKAYANLSGCSEDCKTLNLAYLPDPVCARLAMCMMDEDFEHEPVEGWTKEIQGKAKTWWAGKIREIFSTGMVRPAKGDFGEVVVALYMLFCGDLLRKTISDAAKSENKDSLEYNHFSVSLDAWLDLLCSGGRTPVDTKVPDSESRDGSSMSVGFIQVCRNSIRSYKNSWASLEDQCFLRHIYESGVGFYVFEGCDLIDMVVPLRINRKEAKDEFIPMVVSIKSEWTFQQAHATAACKAMTKRATDSRLTKALCLLIVFGSKPGSHRFKRDIWIASPATGKGRRVSQQDGRTSAVAGKRRRVSQQDGSPSPAPRKSPRVSQQDGSTSSATRKSPRVSQKHASTSPDTDQKPVSQQDASTSSATRMSPRVSQQHASTSPDTDQKPASQQDASHLPAADEILPMSKLLEKYGIVAKAIRVPHNDVFGLTDAFRDMTPDSQVNSELFSSHSFLMAHREGTDTELQAENALCASSGETSKKKYNGLFDAMKTPAKSSSLQG
jgi:hypothetical protein